MKLSRKDQIKRIRAQIKTAKARLRRTKPMPTAEQRILENWASYFEPKPKS